MIICFYFSADRCLDALETELILAEIKSWEGACPIMSDKIYIRTIISLQYKE